MNKSRRMVALAARAFAQRGWAVVVPIVQYVLMSADAGFATDLLGYSLVGWMMVYFGVAGNVTAVQRAHMIWKSLP